MIGQRTGKARAAAQFAKVVQDKDGQVTKVLVPGSEGKQYSVILRRFGSGVVTTECERVIGAYGTAACEGNGTGTVCYHSLAAVLVAARAAGRSVRFAEVAEAERQWRLRRGPSLVRVRAHAGRGEVVALVEAE